jgi:DNA-binding MarR family transcriptional regulator
MTLQIASRFGEETCAVHEHKGIRNNEHKGRTWHRLDPDFQAGNRDEKILTIIQRKAEIDRLIEHKHHELAQHYGLSLEQFHLLIELDELMLDVDSESAPTVGEIANSIDNSQNTVSEKITRLENKGLVTRIKDAKDRRISRIVLTEKGESLIGDISRQANNRFLFDAISRMKDEDIGDLLECLEKLVKEMK